ncbi:MAG TPA: hypothetical protein VFQ68_40865, partial [Streptosporangiaceae bacterium]|nr:hypothetical protein [Streptosporangiaceae bacterium]
EVWGAQGLSGREVTMRLVAKTAPMRQLEVARELRARVKAALDAAGVPPAGPDTILISAPPAPAIATPGSPPVPSQPPAEVELVSEEVAEEPVADEDEIVAQETS